MCDNDIQGLNGAIFIIDEVFEGEKFSGLSTEAFTDVYAHDFDIECERLEDSVRLGATKRGRVITGDQPEEE